MRRNICLDSDALEKLKQIKQDIRAHGHNATYSDVIRELYIIWQHLKKKAGDKKVVDFVMGL